MEYIPLEKQREILKEKIEDMTALEVYFRVNKLYDGIEHEVSSFIEFMKYHVENFSNISKEVLKKAEYLVFDGKFLKYAPGGECYEISNFRLLDKNRALLDVTSDDIENWQEEPLENIMDNIIGDYYFNKADGVGVEIALNY